MNGAVFLDRDNTIIHNDGDLGDPAQVRLIQGAASAIASLKGLNYRIIVVTNQGGVARGKYTEADVDRVNERINELIRANSGVFVDRFYYCPYHPEGTVDRYRRDHPWRKPRPGMLLQAARDLGLDLRQSWMIGDQMRDVQAGFSAGVVPILLSQEGFTPPATKALPPGVTLAPDDRAAAAKMVPIEPVRDYFIVRSLIEAVRLVGQKSRPTNVTAAMKIERIEVVSKPQPRTTMSFDKPSTATEQALESIEQTMVVVNEAATEAASEAITSEIESSGNSRRKSRGEKSRGMKGAAGTATDDAATAIAHSPSTDHVIEEIESKASDESLLNKPEQHVAGASIAVADAVKEPAKSEARSTKATQRRRSTTNEPSAMAATSLPSSNDSLKPTESASTVKVRPASDEPPDAVQSESPSSANKRPADGSGSTVPSLSLSSKAVPHSEPKVDPMPTPGTGSSPMTSEQTLRQILQELRSQRKVGGEFTYAGVMAIVLQMVAGVCLLAGLLMGAGDDGLFLRWMACAVLLQLATLAMLLFRKT